MPWKRAIRKNPEIRNALEKATILRNIILSQQFSVLSSKINQQRNAFALDQLTFSLHEAVFEVVFQGEESTYTSFVLDICHFGRRYMGREK